MESLNGGPICGERAFRHLLSEYDFGDAISPDGHGEAKEYNTYSLKAPQAKARGLISQ